MHRTLITTAAVILLIIGCMNDDMETMDNPTSFSVEIMNVSNEYPFSSTGVFNTPVGATDPAPIGPGEAYEFTFSAAPGHKLSFATMFVHSNDLFYAPDGEGIALYDGDGSPGTGDITDQLILWDAGTEVNEEPGVGANQAPRQSGPDTGPDENGVVQSIMDASDGFTYPAVSDVIRATLMNSGTTFTLRIENVSTSSTLMTSADDMLSVPLAPGVWVVHSGNDPLFTAGDTDPGHGLEALAEDGDPSGLHSVLSSETGLVSPIAPGVWAVHTADMPLFMEGQMDDGMGLEALAEDGDPSGLSSAISGADGVASSGVFNTPVGASAAAPAFPGDSYSFEFEAEPGDRLSLATMLVQSNDLFYAPAENGIMLFDSNDNALSGDITMYFYLWDAGTEVNEEPGIGLSQAPRQSGPDSGADENGTVERISMVNDGFVYPDVSDIIKVTITPMN